MSADLLPCAHCGRPGRYLARQIGFHEEKMVCDICSYSTSVAVWNNRAPVQAQGVTLSEPEQFKAWVGALHPGVEVMLWDAWQARAALAQAPQSDDWKDAYSAGFEAAKGLLWNPGDAREAARWRLMMSATDDPDGPEHAMLSKLEEGYDLEGAAVPSIVMGELTDAAIAALTGSATPDDDGEAFDHNPRAIDKSIARHNAKKATK